MFQQDIVQLWGPDKYYFFCDYYTEGRIGAFSLSAAVCGVDLRLGYA